LESIKRKILQRLKNRKYFLEWELMAWKTNAFGIDITLSDDEMAKKLSVRSGRSYSNTGVGVERILHSEI